MTRRWNTTTEHLDVKPEEFFALIIDPHRLPEWNDVIHHVVSAPQHEAQVGDEWIVEIRAMASKWNSRSRLEEVDRGSNRLALRSQSDDGNPSYAIWSWHASPSGDGTDVTVTWELYPKTFWRRLLFSRIRHQQLKKEVRSSLHAAARLLRSSGARSV